MASTSDDLQKATLHLSKELEHYYFERLKLACLAGVLSDDRIRDITEFSILFTALKQVIPSPDKAVAFCCQVLKRLGYRAPEKYRIFACPEDDFNYQQQYPKVDCMLTVLEFLGNLRDHDFSIIQSYISSKTGQARDKLPTRISVASVLFNEGLISEDNLSFILDLARRFNRKHMFNDYLERLETRQNRCDNSTDDIMRDGGSRSTTSSQQPSRHVTDPVEEQTMDRVQNWANQIEPWDDTNSTISSIDTCTTLSIARTETTAPYAASEHQVENDASFNPGVNELVINQQREESQQSQAVQTEVLDLESIVLSVSSNELVRSNFFEFGKRLGVDEDFLRQLMSKDRSIRYKVEEVLCRWKDSKCSEVSQSNIEAILQGLHNL